MKTLFAAAAMALVLAAGVGAAIYVTTVHVEIPYGGTCTTPSKGARVCSYTGTARTDVPVTFTTSEPTTTTSPTTTTTPTTTGTDPRLAPLTLPDPLPSDITSSSIYFDWSSADPTRTGYRMYYTPSGGVESSQDFPGSYGIVTGLTPSTTYAFQVVALFADGAMTARSNTVAATTAAAPPPPPPPPSGGTNVTAFGARGDGVTDDTAALRAAFSSGGDVYSDAGKTYRVTGALTLVHGANFNGSRINGGSFGDGIISTSGSDARLSNVVVSGGFIAVKVNQNSKLVCTACRVLNSGWGIYVATGALAGTSVSGSSSGNSVGLEVRPSTGGFVPSWDSSGDANFGVITYGISYWHFGPVSVANGQTGFELWEFSHDNVFDKITSRNNQAYALAINHQSNNNTFTNVDADDTGAVDSDPGVSFVDGSSGNTIQTLLVVNHTVGLRFGENDSGTDLPVNNNTVVNYTGKSLAYGGIRFEHGNNNRVKTADLTDIRSVYEPWVRAAVEFSPLSFATTGNVVESVAMHGTLKPSYGVHFGAAASGNSVTGSVLYTTARVLDESGGRNTANVTG